MISTTTREAWGWIFLSWEEGFVRGCRVNQESRCHYLCSVEITPRSSYLFIEGFVATEDSLLPMEGNNVRPFRECFITTELSIILDCCIFSKERSRLGFKPKLQTLRSRLWSNGDNSDWPRSSCSCLLASTSCCRLNSQWDMTCEVMWSPEFL